MTPAIRLADLILRFGRVNRATYHPDGERPESDTDHTVMLGILACAVKWMLDGKPISFETFEAEDCRGDFYPIAVEVAKEAILPLFKSLASLLPAPSETQESDSPK